MGMPAYSITKERQVWLPNRRKIREDEPKDALRAQAGCTLKKSDGTKCISAKVRSAHLRNNTFCCRAGP